jgi:YebC/PmpR family DNA-binding regulatory protein
MSGHSKWNTIKRQKGVADAKRGKEFTRLGNAITIAVREGGGSGDPSANFKLRLAMVQARGANMPKDNIQRAIDRGLGKSGSGGQLESVTYEGYGPEKVAIVVDAVTDNRNRTSSEVRGVIEKNGGTFASQGAVSWMFTDEGLITVNKNGRSFDDLFEKAVDAGAEDVEDGGEFVQVYTKPAELDKVKKVLESKGLGIKGAELTKKASTVVEIKDAESAKKVLNFMEKLEEIDDVSKVYANFDIPDILLEGIQAQLNRFLYS